MRNSKVYKLFLPDAKTNIEIDIQISLLIQMTLFLFYRISDLQGLFFLRKFNIQTWHVALIFTSNPLISHSTFWVCLQRSQTETYPEMLENLTRYKSRGRHLEPLFTQHKLTRVRPGLKLTRVRPDFIYTDKYQQHV